MAGPRRPRCWRRRLPFWERVRTLVSESTSAHRAGYPPPGGPSPSGNLSDIDAAGRGGCTCVLDVGTEFGDARCGNLVPSRQRVRAPPAVGSPRLRTTVAGIPDDGFPDVRPRQLANGVLGASLACHPTRTPAGLDPSHRAHCCPRRWRSSTVCSSGGRCGPHPTDTAGCPSRGPGWWSPGPPVGGVAAVV